MQYKMNTTSFFNIYFEKEQIDYSSYTRTDILNLAVQLLTDRKDILIEGNRKDVDIYL